MSQRLHLGGFICGMDTVNLGLSKLKCVNGHSYTMVTGMWLYIIYKANYYIVRLSYEVAVRWLLWLLGLHELINL